MTRASRPWTVGAALCLSFVLAFAATAFAAPPRKPKPTPAPASAPAARAAPVAAATSIEVTVLQLAGTQAYLQPGANGGVRRGATVVIHRKEYPVVETSDSYAVIDVGADPPQEFEKGQATVVSVAEETPRELAKPQPLSAWGHAWTEAEPPATSQSPRFVPLGSSERDRRWDVRLAAAAGGSIPLGRGGSLSRAEIDARVHAEPFAGPTDLDLDLSLQGWFADNLDARAGAAARPVLWVRELLVSHSMGVWSGGIGRMRYAASTLGTLDGARVRASVGEGVSIGAFGGLLPNPLSGAPSLDAERFGVEATYSRPELGFRPEAALVLHGSTFGGGLDERRVSGTLGIYPGASRVGGYFEVSNFDANNPWKAPAVELTGAGVDASTRVGVLQFGARVDVLQPERSRWLASFLPASWFCRTVPASVGSSGAEPCDGGASTRATAAVDASLAIDDVSLTVGGTTTGYLAQSDATPNMAGAFAAGRVIRLAKIARIDASAGYSRATYLDMLSGGGGPGVTLLGDAVDLSAYYRSATLRYRLSGTSLLQQTLGINVGLFPSSEVVFTLQSEATVGDDSKALLIFGTAMWRPRL
jgi:hypothetical protein